MTSAPRRIRLLLLALLSLGLNVACSSGGSSPAAPGNPGSSPDPGGSSSNTLLTVDAPRFAEVGETFEADCSVFLPGLPAQALPGVPGVPGLAVYALEEAPAGAVLDPATGQVAWTPGPDQGGEHALRVTATVADETLTAEFDVYVRAPRLLASGPISAAAGGVVSVLDAASPYAGTRVDIPPGAMAADVTIEIHVDDALPDLPAGAFEIELCPSQQFAQPVQIELHYDDAYLQTMGIADESRLTLIWWNPETRSYERIPSVADPSANRVFAYVDHFSIFGLLPDLAGYAAEVQQQILETVELLYGTVADPAIEIYQMAKAAYQDNELVDWQGNGFEPDETNLLLLHGVLSSEDNFYALINWARPFYDNIVFFNYGSGDRIANNAAWLARELVEQEDRFPRGCSFDVIAHSMGGLVTRQLNEAHGGVLALAGLSIPAAYFLATPHEGGNPFGLFAASGPGLPFEIRPRGLEDLRPDSSFIESLNRPPIRRGWTKYSCFAGISSGDNDGWVDRESAIPAGLFPIEHYATKFQDHSQIHENIASNGVGSDLASWLQPLYADASLLTLAAASVSLGPIVDAGGGQQVYAFVDADVTFDVDERMGFVPLFLATATMDYQLGGPRFLGNVIYEDGSAIPQGSGPNTEIRSGPVGATLAFQMRAEHVPVGTLGAARTITLSVVHGWIPRAAMQFVPFELEITPIVQ